MGSHLRMHHLFSLSSFSVQNDAMVPTHLTSETGVQQGDPLGPLSFALVLHKALAAIDADDDCLHLILQTWYLDDGVLSGPRSDVRRALSLIKDPGLSLGIIINVAKCKLFNYNEYQCFHLLRLHTFLIWIGDYLHCWFLW